MLYFVTSREKKFIEAKKILDIPLKRIDLDLPEVQAVEVGDVVRAKARAAWQKIQKPCLVEDTGLYLEALNGFPGALGKWVEKTMGWAGFLNLLAGVRNRRAYAQCTICLFDGKKDRLFSGRVWGKISQQLQGDAGIGWDVIFIPQGFRKTFAEMTMREKNQISHRGIAFRKLAKYLRDQKLGKTLG